ncbi:MAG: PKD domain-containing protein [Saprospiraceae bacterium]
MRRHPSFYLPYFPVPSLIVVSPDAFQGCAPADIFFNNRSTPINESYTFEWRFGDGGTGDALSPTHTYTNIGVYDVYLSITSPIGCMTDTTFLALIEIEPAPIAGFTTSPICLTTSSLRYR